MAKQFKCTQCKESFDIELKGKFTSEKITNKRTGEQVVTIKHFCSEECKELFDNPPISDYRLLTDYIDEVYVMNGIKLNKSQWTMITAQIDKMVTMKNKKEDSETYSYFGIKYCLWYMIEVAQMSLINDEYNGSILNLVPYHYDDSRKFWCKRNEIQKAVDNFDFEDTIIYINRKPKDEIKYNDDIDIGTL